MRTGSQNAAGRTAASEVYRTEPRPGLSSVSSVTRNVTSGYGDLFPRASRETYLCFPASAGSPLLCSGPMLGPRAPLATSARTWKCIQLKPMAGTQPWGRARRVHSCGRSPLLEEFGGSHWGGAGWLRQGLGEGFSPSLCHGDPTISKHLKSFVSPLLPAGGQKQKTIRK